MWFFYSLVNLLSKKLRKFNINKLIREGMDIGGSKEYNLWIKLQYVLSLGRVTRVKGIKKIEILTPYTFF
jgi:hypothetical protein